METVEIVEKGPDIDKIETTATNDVHAINGFVASRVPVIAAKKTDLVAHFDPAFGQFMNVDFGPAGPNMLEVAPIKNSDP